MKNYKITMVINDINLGREAKNQELDTHLQKGRNDTFNTIQEATIYFNTYREKYLKGVEYRIDIILKHKVENEPVNQHV